MNIRRATQTDLTQLLDMYDCLYDGLYDILIGEYGYPFSFSREANAEVLAVRLKSKLFGIFVAEENGALAGFVHGSVTKLDRRLSFEGQNSIARIDEIYVKDEYRGSGAAAALLGAAEDWFAQSGVSIVESYILSENFSSIRFHEKLGYKTTTVRMIKRLL
jgi:ribosomal protein S18 acetylase RimI-like enzyme